MRTLDLAIKDLTQVWRDRKTLLFLIVMPIAFTGFMGLAYQRNDAADSRLAVGWHDADGGLLSVQLKQLIDSSGAVRLVALQAGADADVQVKSGSLAAAVLVPAGFSSSALTGEAAPVTVLASPGSTTGQTAQQVVQAALLRTLGAAQAAQISVRTLEARRPFSSQAERQAEVAAALQAAIAEWQSPPLTVVNRDAHALPAVPAAPNSFTQSSPGMLVMFGIFGLMTSASVLVTERKTHTLQRLLTTSMSRAEVIAGHMLAMVLVVLTQEALLVVTGQLIYKVDYARAPIGVAIVALALAIWVASLGLLIAVLAKGEEQVNLWALMAMFVFAALGGAWFPLEVTGQTFAAIGHLMPSAWAMDGFQNLVVRGLPDTSALLPAAVLTAYACVFLAVAVWRFREE